MLTVGLCKRLYSYNTQAAFKAPATEETTTTPALVASHLLRVLATMPSYAPNYEAAFSEEDAVQRVVERLRASLKRRGAEGIRGLARHFKVNWHSLEYLVIACCVLSPS